MIADIDDWRGRVLSAMRKLCEYYQAYQKRFTDRLRRVSSPSDDQQEPQSFDAGS